MTAAFIVRFWTERLKKTILVRLRTVAIDPEMLKITYYEMLEEAGVDLLLYSFVCDVIMEQGTVVGIVTSGKSGLVAYSCSIVIDGTGDGV